ncbi:hypothetical protein M9H77_31144 [Catharanthus roseus]|uniref:Uncharacterized protein n=1 Tax=Catharanthus roseus TaxID=4058 RepID=A0ACC0A1X1_CATRO|nr:hypothetical protein M9H77_31144 [Catharanthus roseus]
MHLPGALPPAVGSAVGFCPSKVKIFVGPTASGRSLLPSARNKEKTLGDPKPSYSSRWKWRSARKQDWEVLNVLIMYGWKSNLEGYVRYHEGCSYNAHNQGGNAYDRDNYSGTNFTPRGKDSISNFSPCARSFEHTSYKFYEGNIFEVENGIAYRLFERVPRKDTRNEKDYVNMDESSI